MSAAAIGFVFGSTPSALCFFAAFACFFATEGRPALNEAFAAASCAFAAALWSAASPLSSALSLALCANAHAAGLSMHERLARESLPRMGELVQAGAPDEVRDTDLDDLHTFALEQGDQFRDPRRVELRLELIDADLLHDLVRTQALALEDGEHRHRVFLPEVHAQERREYVSGEQVDVDETIDVHLERALDLHHERAGTLHLARLEEPGAPRLEQRARDELRVLLLEREQPVDVVVRVLLALALERRRADERVTRPSDGDEVLLEQHAREEHQPRPLVDARHLAAEPALRGQLAVGAPPDPAPARLAPLHGGAVCRLTSRASPSTRSATARPRTRRCSPSRPRRARAPARTSCRRDDTCGRRTSRRRGAASPPPPRCCTGARPTPSRRGTSLATLLPIESPQLRRLVLLESQARLQRAHLAPERRHVAGLPGRARRRRDAHHERVADRLHGGHGDCPRSRGQGLDLPRLDDLHLRERHRLAPDQQRHAARLHGVAAPRTLVAEVVPPRVWLAPVPLRVQLHPAQPPVDELPRDDHPRPDAVPHVSAPSETTSALLKTTASPSPRNCASPRACTSVPVHLPGSLSLDQDAGVSVVASWSHAPSARSTPHSSTDPSSQTSIRYGSGKTSSRASGPSVARSASTSTGSMPSPTGYRSTTRVVASPDSAPRTTHAAEPPPSRTSCSQTLSSNRLLLMSPRMPLRDGDAFPNAPPEHVTATPEDQRATGRVRPKRRDLLEVLRVVEELHPGEGDERVRHRVDERERHIVPVWEEPVGLAQVAEADHRAPRHSHATRLPH